jgi:D-alanyl-D-alanine carboxypeptidase
MKAGPNLASKLQQSLITFVQDTGVHGTVLNIHKDSKEPFDWIGASGNLESGSPYFYTSVAKLHITAIALKLRVRGKLELDWKISSLLPETLIKHLHLYRNRDFSQDISIRHLLSHTSGLPDYFHYVFPNGESLLDRLKNGIDQEWNFEQVVYWIKKMKPKFFPGEKGKVYYSDSNFQLLVPILEKIAGKSLEKLIRELHDQPLGISERYQYSDPKDRTPSLFYYEEKPLLIPKAMKSFGADGGMVGTAKSSMTFLKAFFHGQLFPQEYLPETQLWNAMGNGHYYGLGIASYRPGGFNRLVHPSARIIGHAGMSGAFAYYLPERRLFFTGTVNQLQATALPIKLVQKMIKVLEVL